MAYAFDFASVLEYREVLVDGTLKTLALTAIGTVLGLAVGILGAVSRAWKLAPFDRLFAVYVEAIRNTPFLVQLFFIFFGLPSLGVQINEWQAAILAVVVNLGAYTTEIIRAGIEATPKGQIEAAQSLAMGRAQIFRHVVLPPALLKVWPAICSQVVIVMLGTSVCSQIAAEELTFAANFIQSRNFRAFETYFVVTAIYFLLAIAVRQVLIQAGQRLIARRTK
ncbi:amino acid ABC transporter membrane protein 1 (PAAT family) [Azonexus fungiphilus]|jgi:His/Glu/Gln/Arg/opine family amino acid ABC transporter permease subunit|uniref:Amino acid ABC transporter membrane protein 1 (PAAT family) n=1 Tax=Azonexus fungiphilus TaxID=146940 RepID=A0A495W8L8_9RHOO|nr:amino acid ABC transporter permease [Azonexus fungiphilus]RKT58046.1 amino acid ABC transporter membrane protein 1 (PAAT family) [Azonexus fungiphilus]